MVLVVTILVETEIFWNRNVVDFSITVAVHSRDAKHVIFEDIVDTSLLATLLELIQRHQAWLVWVKSS